MLRDRGAPFLADTLTLVAEMRTPGRWATNLLPGSSWHQFGEAIDLGGMMAWIGGVAYLMLGNPLWWSKRHHGRWMLRPIQVSRSDQS
jgi:hypothetical protein